MNSALPFVITIAIAPIMGLMGYFVFRLLNLKIVSSQTWRELILYGVLLILCLGIIFMVGLYLMAYIFISLSE
jgi:hypothetical protein